MLVPAILYKDEIEKEFKKLYYTKDMFFETGGIDNWMPDVKDIPEDYNFQFAIVSQNNVIGYLSYYIDYYVDKVYNFELISFDRGNPIVGKDLYNELERLIKSHHRVEWRMVGENPVERHYDKFCKDHNGNKYVFKDALKDCDGNYHDDVLYEIVKCKDEKNETRN